MNPLEFVLDPAACGLPTREELAELRIWDVHYYGFLNPEHPIGDHEAMQFFVERLGIERSFALDMSGQAKAVLDPAPVRDEAQRRLLEEKKDRVSGIIAVDPSDPDLSCRKMEQWIRRGPAVGICVQEANRDSLACSHPNMDPIIRLAVELNALVYLHTWLKVGGKPRRVGGGQLRGESTPLDVVQLGKRFPGVPLICGHAGGDWEIGAQMVREHPDIYFEFAGTDPNSGAVDFAVAQLGVDRILWGSHAPSRSYSSALAMVLDADLTKAQRRQVFGGNLRRLAEPIFRQKGYSLGPPA